MKARFLNFSKKNSAQISQKLKILNNELKLFRTKKEMNIYFLNPPNKCITIYK